jgi:hypothetical protein
MFGAVTRILETRLMQGMLVSFVETSWIGTAALNADQE